MHRPSKQADRIKWRSEKELPQLKTTDSGERFFPINRLCIGCLNFFFLLIVSPCGCFASMLGLGADGNGAGQRVRQASLDDSGRRPQKTDAQVTPLAHFNTLKAYLIKVY